jgi:two-component system, NarL family, capsular synthesis sensor histidine kinase RcsC
LRVLIVDDEPSVREVVAEMLRYAGHDIVVADAGLGLFDALAAATFDLVLTDLAMPEITGWDVAAWVRKHRPGTPVVAFTGHSEFLRGANSFAEFTAVLMKPLRRRELVQAVEQAATQKG